MYQEPIALLAATRLASIASGSALPDSPVIDDAFDRLTVGERLAAFRKRLAELIWPGERIAPARTPSTAPSLRRDSAVAGC